MTDFEDSKNVLHERDTLKGHFEVKGKKYPLVVDVVTKGELKDIENEALAETNGEADAAEEDFIDRVIQKYLVEPEGIDPDEVPLNRLRSLFEGMKQTWQESEEVADAMDSMQVPEGNRPASRNLQKPR